MFVELGVSGEQSGRFETLGRPFASAPHRGVIL